MKPTTHSDGTTSTWAFMKWQTITRADDQPYLTRLILVRCAWFAIYLHWFVGNDDLCLHDHPWAFVSVILWGGYYEWTTHHWKRYQRCRWYRPGSILVRRANWTHRVALAQRADGSLRPACTLVVTGPKVRSWGFHTLTGWIPWRQYDYAKHCSD